MYCAANSRRRSQVSRESTLTFSTSRRIRSRTARSGRREVLVDAAADLGGCAELRLDQVPGALEVGDVLGQRLGRLAFGIGAHDVAVAAGSRQFGHQ